jgi:hypothetical protein
MRIGHLTSHNINVGDGAFIGVIQSYMRGCEIDNVDIISIDVTNVDLSHYDKVVVGGGGVITSQRVKSCSALESGVSTSMLDERYSFVALGYNTFYGQDYNMRDELRELVGRANDLGIPFSVRMDGGKERILEEVGIDIEEIPDPGLFIEVDESYTPPQIDPNRLNVVMQVAGDNPELRGEYVNVLANLAGLLIHDCGVNIILAPHITRDLEVTSEVATHLSDKYFRGSLCMTGIVHPRNAAQYFKVYKDADLVIGMRGHSVICGVGLGTPTVAIDTHPKVGGFMRKVGLGDWVMREQVDYGFIKSALFGEEKFEPKLDGLREKLDNFMGRVMC